MAHTVEQYSEIGTLQTVLLHRPGEELSMIMPDFFDTMLLDDMPHPPHAVRDHDIFADTIRKSGAEVLYLADLFAEAVEKESVRLAYIEDYIAASHIMGETVKDAVRAYLSPLTPKALFHAVSRGILRRDLAFFDPLPIPLRVKDPYPFVVDPMPNMYFTRDVCISIGSGLLISTMRMQSRERETLFIRYIHDHHPLFAAEKSPLWHEPGSKYGIEGGDVLILSDKVLAVGCGERTSIAAVECLANRVFAHGYERIIIFNNPRARKFMHLDVLCTMVDHDTFLTHPCVYEKQFDVYELTGSPGKLRISLSTDPVSKIFSKALRLPAVRFIEMGGGDPITAAREHWNMGSNSLALAPGHIIAYDRNDATNEHLAKAGIRVDTVPGSELCRGRGGPRCMSMPLKRERY
ncbi:MAG: arginine deiminase [Clostridia bacterium]|nr:arginine deiminase [Clostridia bacterium]